MVNAALYSMLTIRTIIQKKAWARTQAKHHYVKLVNKKCSNLFMKSMQKRRCGEVGEEIWDVHMDDGSKNGEGETNVELHDVREQEIWKF